MAYPIDPDVVVDPMLQPVPDQPPAPVPPEQAQHAAQIVDLYKRGEISREAAVNAIGQAGAHNERMAELSSMYASGDIDQATMQDAVSRMDVQGAAYSPELLDEVGAGQAPGLLKLSPQERLAMAVVGRVSSATGGAINAGALEGFGAISDYGSEAAKRYGDMTGGVTGPLIAPAALAGEIGRGVVELPFMAGLGAADAAVGSLPGDAPVSPEYPPQVQPSEPPPLQDRPGQGQPPAMASGRPAAPPVPRVGAHTGGISRVLRDIEKGGENYAEAINKLGAAKVTALNQQIESAEQVSASKAEFHGRTAEILQGAANSTEAHIAEKQDLIRFYKEERESRREKIRLSREAEKYHRMDREEVATRVTRVESNEARLREMKAERSALEEAFRVVAETEEYAAGLEAAPGIPYGMAHSDGYDPTTGKKYKSTGTTDLARSTEGIDNASLQKHQEDIKAVEAQIAADKKALNKASKMRGEWDFDDPTEIFAAVAMIIAQAGGAYASAMTGAPNYAMQIAKDRTKRIIDMQKMEISLRKSETEGYVNDLDMLKGELDTDLAAENEIYLDQLNLVRTVMEKISAESSGEQERAALGGAIGKLQEASAAAAMETEQAIDQSAMQKSNARLSGEGAKAKLRMAAENANRMAAMARQQAEAEGRPDRTMQIPGLRVIEGYAPDKDDRKAVQKIYPAFQSAQGLLGDLIKKRGDIWSYLPRAFSGSKAEAEAIRADLVNIMKDMEGMGANFTMMEKELLELQVGDSPSNLYQQTAKLRQTMLNQQSKIQHKLRAYKYEIDPGLGGSFFEMLERPAM